MRAGVLFPDKHSTALLNICKQDIKWPKMSHIPNLTINIRQGYKVLQETNTLTYIVSVLIMKKKGLM